MRKIIILIVLSLGLIGCSTNTNKVKLEISRAIDVGEAIVPFKHPNNYKPTFSYYLPNNIAVIESNDNSSLLRYRNHQIIMNLNVSAIIADKYYKNVSQTRSELKVTYFYEYQGAFRDFLNRVQQYSIEIFSISGPKFYLALETKYINYFVVASASELSEIIPVLLTIAKTVDVDQNRIVALYSKKIELKDAQVTRLPAQTDGLLIDMIEGYEHTTDWTDNIGGPEEIEEQNETPEKETTEDENALEQ